MIERSSFVWWNSITGPNSLLQAITSALLEVKSVVIYVPDDLPWRKQMRSSLEGMLRESTQNLVFDYIDCELECQTDSKGNLDIAGFLFERYSTPSVKNGYRKSSGKSVQQYMQEHHVLGNAIIWVKGMTNEQVKSWFDFCKAYKPKNTNDGLFVLEAYLPNPLVSVPSSMSEISYRDHVSLYDALLFNYMIVSEWQDDPSWLQYVATASTNLCVHDVELSCSLIEECNFKADDVIDALRSLATEEDYGKRYAADNLEDDHPFAMIRSGRDESMAHALWQAQLQVVFPLIEMERLSLISLRKRELEIAIAEKHFDPQTGEIGKLEYCGNEITSPLDLELGTLRFMTHRWFADDHEKRYFSLPDYEDRERLLLLRNMRNKIAHMNVCSIEEIVSFFEKHPYSWHLPSEHEFDD